MALADPTTPAAPTSKTAAFAIYFVAFVTGAIVMSFEMLGSRYLNPYFGSGIYTWASLISTVLCALIAYPLAYFIAFKAGNFKNILLGLVMIPFFTSFLLRTIAWKIILGFNGLINSGLMRLHLIDQPLGFLLYNPFAVVLTLAHAWAAFSILPIYVSLEKIDRSLLEAAGDLGDGPLRRFLRITLPLSMPGVVGAALLIFVPTTGDYVTPALVGGTQGAMIANLIEVQFISAGNWPLGAALSLAGMAMVAIIATIAFTLRTASSTSKAKGSSE